MNTLLISTLTHHYVHIPYTVLNTDTSAYERLDVEADVPQAITWANYYVYEVHYELIIIL